MNSKSLVIDMIAGSQLRDTQGETLSIEGADISELEAGRGRINNDHGKGFFNCLGKVTGAKKIFKVEDCEDDRQRYYWEKVKSPYIYVKAELFNDEDHPNAKAAAAILRNIHKTDCPLKIKSSVEGGVIARGLKDSTLLARTKIHSVALTFVPANQATLVEPLNLDKSSDHEADLILIKSVLHLAQTNVPSFRHITRAASADKIEQNINKIMTALGKEVPVDLKQELIKASLERRIADNIININQLVKGSMQRLAPNPSYPTAKEDFWPGGDKPINAAGEKRAQQATIKLFSNKFGPSHVQTRLNKETSLKEPHVLLHRGMNYDEAAEEAEYGSDWKKVPGRFTVDPDKNQVGHQDEGMWTNRDAAQTYGTVHSAWVPASKIKMLGHKVAGAMRSAKEKSAIGSDNHAHVLVKPGMYDYMSPEESKKIFPDNIIAINQLVKSIPNPKALWDAAGGASAPHDHPSHQVLKDHWLEQGHPVDESGQLKASSYDALSRGLHDFVKWDKLHPNARPLLSTINNNDWKNRNQPLQPHETSNHPGMRGDHQRALDAANHSIRNHLPAFLDGHPELKEHAARLRALPELKTEEDFENASPHVEAAVNIATELNHPSTHAQFNNAAKKSWAAVDDAGNKVLKGVLASGRDSVWWAGQRAQIGAREAAGAHHLRGNNLNGVSKKLNHSVHEMLWNWAYPATPTVEKSLTAGYGGAGSPLGMTGGGVLQSESQELGPKGLNFITCDHCGKEQVYGKFQVKCREPNCGKAFSMNKLEKFFQIRRK